MKMSSKINPDDFSLSQLTTYQIGAMQAAAYRALKKHKDGLLKEYGISGMQWHITGTVFDSEPHGIRISELAAILDTTMSYLTTNVNLLESKGVLVRSANAKDGRSTFVHVSPEFMPKCAEIEASLRDKLRSSIYAKVSPEELLTYVKVTAKFAELD